MELGNKPSKVGTPIPGREPAFYEIPWIRNLIRVCAALVVVALLWECGIQIQRYGTKVVETEFTGKTPPGGKAPAAPRMDLYAELKNKPAWLDKVILDQIFAETIEFAARDQRTYDRLLNPLDKEILGEVAANYTGIDKNGANHKALRNNAWIKKVTEVKRVIDKKLNRQTIEIYAEFRVPAAWVISPAPGGKCYLVDDEMVRLPGEYSQADRKATSGLMAVTGLESASVPEPGTAWSGEDLAAGLKLAKALEDQKFVSQIDAIDMTNFRGRKNPKTAWIVLSTQWQTAGGSPRVVMWGRPVGEESYFEVKSPAKIKALNEINLRFNRIDAGRDFVDIRTEQVWLPKLATQAEDDGMGRRARG